MADELPTTGLPKLTATSDASAVLRHDTSARFLLALIVIAQFVALVGVVVWKGIQLPDSQFILGAEISFVSVILAYFFGSSAGSVTKSAKPDPATTEVTPSP